MHGIRQRLTAAWRAVERFAERPSVPAAVFLLSLVVYAVVAYALPLAGGRDIGTYLRSYGQIFSTHLVYPEAVAARAPVTPIVAGGLLEAGPVVAEAAMALLYALSVLAWYLTARRLGPAPAVVFAAAILVYPSYALLFHRLASDSLFAAAFALFALLLARGVERPDALRLASLGAAVALLVLVRPVAQVLLLLVLLPLLLPGGVRERLARSAAFVAAVAAPLLVWASLNAVRADDFTVARGAGHAVPLYRVFVVDRTVRPDNGPASRELAQAVQEDLLPLEPYRSYGITLDEFFSSGSPRMQEDLTGLSDRRWGWDDDYKHLQRAAVEAVRKHPGTYARGVVKDLYRLLWWPLFLSGGGGDGSSGGEPSGGDTIVVNGKVLPRPSEGQPIPSAHQSGFVSTPDQRMREVWTSPTDHHIEYDDPADARRGQALERKMSELFAEFPDRSGHAWLAKRLDQASRWYPRALVWLLVGLVAFLLRRPRGALVPLLLTVTGLFLLATTALAVDAVAEYAVPVVPGIMLLTVAGMLGPRRV